MRVFFHARYRNQYVITSRTRDPRCSLQKCQNETHVCRNNASEPNFRLDANSALDKIAIRPWNAQGEFISESKRQWPQKHRLEEINAASKLGAWCRPSDWMKLYDLEIFLTFWFWGLLRYYCPFICPQISPKCLVCMGLHVSWVAQWGSVFNAGIRYDPGQLANGSKRKWNLREISVLMGLLGHMHCQFSWLRAMSHLSTSTFLCFI